MEGGVPLIGSAPALLGEALRSARREVPHDWIIDPRDESLTVHRWTPDGYVEALLALRGERVRPEPFGAVEWAVGVLFGDDDEG